MPPRLLAAAIALLLFHFVVCPLPSSGGDDAPGAWRSLPLVKEGKVDPAWVHLGYGSFVVDDGMLRTECSEKGLGLLLFEKEKFGDCQIRVVFKTKDAKSNAGVY